MSDKPWDTEWAAQKAAEALQYLGRNYPECLASVRALDEYEEQAHRAAVRGDREGYLEALRAYMRAGRDAARLFHNDSLQKGDAS
jgi:hypothetical protein